ncbi:unnamed protein product [Cuscuta europaea]|uniref:Uncharacterized protein n=1 Tax=Cuscuta europaea TaxID=41803 RepID=A0A9P1DWK9_CUSEU|nr:unnamed protein product [Cuscuta europaea]
MGVYKHNNELFPERRGISGVLPKPLDSRRGRRLRRISKRSVFLWVLLLVVLFSIYLIAFGLKMHFHGALQDDNSSLVDVHEEVPVLNVSDQIRKKPRRQK